MEWGIFNDESQDWTYEEAVETGFFSEEEAERAIEQRYSEEDGLVVHLLEEADEDEEEEGCEDEE